MKATNSLMISASTKEVDYSQIIIGNSCFTDDVWDMTLLVPSKTLASTSKIIKFSYIKSNNMKQTVKLYAYYKLARTKPQSVRNYINGCLPSFIKYCDLIEIKSFRNVTAEDFLNFSLWLKNEKQVSISHGYECTAVVEEIIRVGQLMGWDVPQNNIFAIASSADIWRRDNEYSNKTKPIPKDIFDKILYFSTFCEKDILTKAGIIIQSQTGLRINEVLSIREGCVHPTSDGYIYMEVMLSKTEKEEPRIHKVFINDLVKGVIYDLSNTTKNLRQESGLKELFLVKKGGIFVVKTQNWPRRMDSFIRRWDIRDNKGNLYSLHSHQFRATFVRELIKQNVPIAIIMKQFSHVSLQMTAHYLTLQEEEIKKIYAEMVFNPESKIAGLRAKEIRNKLDCLFHGKTEAEIDAVISELSKTTSFNPLPTGVCLYDFMRGNCTDGDGCFMYNCPNYITEIQFYPILKDELNLMEIEMSRLKELQRERDWQRQYIKWKHLKPLVECLEEQLNGKESIRE